jgi:hypothetical protein
MAISKWVYTLATGQFTRGGFYDPPFDSATEGVVGFPDADPMPDVRLQRFDAERGKRPATADEIAAFDQSRLDAQATGEIQSNPQLVAVSLALHALLLGRAPTDAEQLAIFRNVKVYARALQASGFPVPAAAVTPLLS